MSNKVPIAAAYSMQTNESVVRLPTLDSVKHNIYTNDTAQIGCHPLFPGLQHDARLICLPGGQLPFTTAAPCFCLTLSMLKEHCEPGRQTRCTPFSILRSWWGCLGQQMLHKGTIGMQYDILRYAMS